MGFSHARERMETCMGSTGQRMVSMRGQLDLITSPSPDLPPRICFTSLTSRGPTSLTSRYGEIHEADMGTVSET